MSAEISVIIVTLRDDILPVRYFESSQFDDYEIIVRRDDGISTARNKGVEEAEGDKVVFIDDDAIPCESYLSIASACLDEHPVVAGRVIQPSDDPFSHWELPHYDQGTKPKSTDRIVGCNMAFRREVFDEYRFDERFVWGREETEFIRRISPQYRVYYDPELVVQHSYASSRRHYWNKMCKFGMSDVKWWTKSEHLSLKHIRWSLPWPWVPAATLCETRNATKAVGAVAQRYGRIKQLLRESKPTRHQKHETNHS